MAGPWDRYAQPTATPWVKYSTPGSGPKAPTGFAAPGAARVAPIPGSEADPAYVAQRAAATAQVEQAAHVSAERKLIAMREAADLDTYKKKKDIDNNQAGSQIPNSNVHGDAYLKLLPPEIQGVVKKIATGDLAPPSGAALKTPYWQQVIQHTINYDPSFAGMDYSTRAATRSNYANGKMGVNITALNTALGHAGELLSDSKDLNNKTGIVGVSLYNPIRNWLLKHQGDTRPGNFDNDARAFGGELSNVFTNGGGGQGEREDWATSVPRNGSPSQQTSILQHDALLLKSRLDALNDQYKRGMGHAADITDLLNPHARDVYNKLLAGAGVPPGSLPGATPPASGGPPPSGGAPNNPYGPAHQPSVNMALATGNMREVPDHQANAVLDSLIRSGANDAQINAALKAINHQPINPNQTAAARAYMAKHPDYQGGFGVATKTEDQGWLNKAAASPTGTFIGSAVDGGLGGFTDETTGLIDKALHGGDLSGLIADANARKQAAYATNPKSSIAGNIAGTAATALAGGVMLRGTSGAAALGKYAPYVGGGIYGGISGAGQNNDNRLGGAALGAAAGVVGTGVGQGLAYPVGAIARTAPVRATINGARRMFGASPIQPAAALSPAERDLFNATTKAGPDNVRSFLDQASNLGVPASLADTTPEIRELAAAAVRRSPTAAQTAETTFLPRARGQIDRFGAAVNRDLGPVANIPQLSEDMTQQAKTAAAPLYDAAYAAPGASSVKLDDLMPRPSMRAGLARARSIALEDGRDPNTLGFDLDQEGNVTIGRTPSFQTLDYVKRGLDDTLEPHRNLVTGKLELNEATRAINATKNVLLNRIDEVNPDYAAARQAYAGPVQARDALARGQDSLSLSPDELQMQAGNQSPEQLAQMQLGQRSALMARANKVRDVSNPFDATLGTPNARAQIEALHANNPGTANLFATRDMEGQIARSANDILGNSKTPQRQIADKAFAGGDLGDMISAGIDLYHGGIPVTTVAKAGLGRAGMFAAGKRAVAKADELAPMVFDTDPRAAAARINDLIAQQLARNQYVQKMRPTGIMGMLGNGFGASTAQGY